MANVNTNTNADPFWFLENLEDSESKTEQIKLQEKEQTDNSKGSQSWTLDYTQDVNTKLGETTQKLQDDKEKSVITNLESKDNTAKVILDENSLRSEIESSIIDLTKDTIEKGQNPEVLITIDMNDVKNTLDEDKIITNGEATKDYSKVNITVNATENGQDIGESKKFEIDTSFWNNDDDAVSEKEETNNPTVYIVVNSKTGANSTGDKTLKLSSSNNQLYEVLGSTTLNLNDLAAKTKSVSGEENKDGSNKVELVITIKDERKKESDEDLTTNFNNDFNDSFTQVDNSLNDSLESRLKAMSERIKNLSEAIKSSTNNSWNDNLSQDHSTNRNSESSWSNVTKDSFVRDTDGARCYRTVWTTPNGKKVQTQCFKDERNSPRGRRVTRNYDWYPSIFRSIDDEFDRILNRASRLMYF